MSETLTEEDFKREKGKLAAEGEADLESMELGQEGDLAAELGLDEAEGTNEGDDEFLTIKADQQRQMAARYQVPGQPDYFHYRVQPLTSLADNHTTTVENDWWLDQLEPMAFFGRSIKHVARQHAGWEARSAYDKKTHKFHPYVKTHQPRHGHTEGGKGLALYPAVVIYHTGDMSSILNLNITFGCPSNCSFCKESLLARGFTQMNMYETAGYVRITTETRPPFDVPASTRVKFFDTKIGQVVIGPLSVPVMHSFPIATDSLDKLRDGTLNRVLAD